MAAKSVGAGDQSGGQTGNYKNGFSNRGNGMSDSRTSSTSGSSMPGVPVGGLPVLPGLPGSPVAPAPSTVAGMPVSPSAWQAFGAYEVTAAGTAAAQASARPKKPTFQSAVSNKNATLVEVGLPPAHATQVQPEPIEGQDKEKPPSTVAKDVRTRVAVFNEFAFGLPPSAQPQRRVDGESTLRVDTNVLDLLRPKLRKPDRRNLLRRNRRRNSTLLVYKNSTLGLNGYQPVLSSRPSLHAVQSVVRVKTLAEKIPDRAKSMIEVVKTHHDARAIAKYYGEVNYGILTKVQRTARDAYFPGVKISKGDLQKVSFRTDIFKGRQSLFRFDSMRTKSNTNFVADTRVALQRLISHVFSPRAGSFLIRENTKVS